MNDEPFMPGGLRRLAPAVEVLAREEWDHRP